MTKAVAPEDWPCVSMAAIVDTDGLDDGQYLEAVRVWIEATSQVLAGDLFGRYAAGDEMVTANTYVDWGGGADIDHAPFSPARVAQVLDQCADRGRPELILLAAEEESDNGFLVPGAPGESFSARLEVKTSAEMPGVVSFSAVATYWSPDERMPVPVQERWLDVCARFCEDLPLTFGSISSGDGVRGVTALDRALGRGESESVRASLSVLRGYSWVTMCPPPIVERLGGVTKLEESKRFWRLRPLASGAVWAQATERLDDYKGAVIEGVFRVFAPVLPAGLVEPIWGDSWPTLVHADASQYRDDGPEGWS
ncbi:hypothetical protein [Kribbella shirazensis]|uniref:DUF3396 domain-containing protein n=1 Tax=Kribbella shirazensis TaxID=1105143 RepID=A0A7X5ZZE7_9ACTN|nr:hypothetical protein [Kribbella shirazensis]NIK56121.1 hypothetical protein [Kribbella shirazensis]